MKVAQVSAPASKQACYDQGSLSAYNSRMVQQEMAVGTLSCAFIGIETEAFALPA